jgi:DNA invertase Pin-like site-specific DNA recombinase
VTTRYDEHGKPIGLDWAMCTDGDPRPEVWTTWREPAPKERGVGSTVEEEQEEGQVRSRKRLSPATEGLIIRMYRDEGKSARECALAAGVKPPTVFKVLNRNGIPSRGYHQTIRSVTPDQETEIVRRYVDELESSGQISKALGVSNRTVSRALVRAEVTIRTPSESAKLDRRRRAKRSA